MRYMLRLSYSGAGFSGWQVQDGVPTVQESLEHALGLLLGGKCAVTGAGRTDTLVSASGYVAHFDSPEPLEPEQFAYKLNAILPRSIVVHEVRAVPDDFHARFSAKRREYTYFLHTAKDPFLEAWSWRCSYKLDFEAMNAAAEALLGEHDFSSFEKTGSDVQNPICTVYEALWTPVTGIPVVEDGHLWAFRIAANRFLRNMVRATVGTLVEVGRGRRAPDSIPALLAERNRSLAGESAPGHALFLTGVEY